QRNDKPENENGVNVQFSGEALDVATKFQRLQNSVVSLKKKNEAFEKEKGELINKFHELTVKNDQLQTSCNELTSRYDSEKRRWQQRANDSDLEIQALKKQLNELKEEASRYQSALGEATNVRFGDNDSNNQVQLSKAIIEMQNLLVEFTTVKGKDITINEKAAFELLNAYNLPFYNDKLLNSMNQPPIDDANLESEITTHMITLCNLISRLAETRNGTDEITRVAPVKVRQQVYTVLGSRGFCKDNHPIIEKLANYILESTGKCRKISEEKQLEFQNKALEVVKKFVHLYFRLNAQEPIPSYSYYFEAGTPLANSVMDGPWDDDNLDNLEVEICSFPLIYIKGKDNSKKILSKALVLPREKE
ncbi:16594_t:CDS:2, partial [Dentiscutata erythropus]